MGESRTAVVKLWGVVQQRRQTRSRSTSWLMGVESYELDQGGCGCGWGHHPNVRDLVGVSEHSTLGEQPVARGGPSLWGAAPATLSHA